MRKSLSLNNFHVYKSIVEVLIIVPSLSPSLSFGFDIRLSIWIFDDDYQYCEGCEFFST
ncbi:hypothetical protein MtrunA17_Chr3g0098131 [Medicago truncatula]|uniref:Uncharacterized protein n=1 Tax=Medicago truncatula TaxID=3880 RepID=A0A396INY3_MEDTR|nr:hypothetical protein MtrunA17_Chr3g0098131 [Medicago truncatula]